MTLGKGVRIKQAVILVGGRGTRLGALTQHTPKPLLPVCDRPFLAWLLDEVARHGFSSVLLVAGHLGRQIAEQFDGRRIRKTEIEVVVEDRPSGTAGALRFAEPHLDEVFLLMNGDTFFDINLLDLASSFGDSLAHVALRRTSPGRRYGRVRLDGDRVLAFDPPGPGTGPINGGIYVVRRALVELIGNGCVSLENDVFPLLAHRRQLTGRLYKSFFIDIGVPGDFEHAQTAVPQRVRRPAVFLDRDGVLNRDIGYPHLPDHIEWTPRASRAVKLLNDRGYFVFVVTNQAGVAHGRYGEDAVAALHAWMADELARAGAHVDAFSHCPFHPDARVQAYRMVSAHRKPQPGMILDILADWPVDTGGSFLVGDRESDVAAARAAGLPGYLFPGGDLLGFIEPLSRG